MTGAAPTRLIHGPWVGLSALPGTRPDLDDDVWSELCWQASEHLYLLSGRQWAGVRETTVALKRPVGRLGPKWRQFTASLPLAPSSLLQPSSFLLPASGMLPGAGATGSWPVRWIRETNVVVALPDPPTTSVEGVVIGSDPFDDWTAWLPVGHLERTDGQPWPLDGSVAVTYRHGLLPPSGGVAAALELTMELGKAMVADANCKLPKRTTSIQREGVTIAVITDDELYKERRTGIPGVDRFLMAVNPNRLTRRMSAWSPDQARTRRTTA